MLDYCHVWCIFNLNSLSVFSCSCPLRKRGKTAEENGIDKEITELEQREKMIKMSEGGKKEEGTFKRISRRSMSKKREGDFSMSAPSFLTSTLRHL